MGSRTRPLGSARRRRGRRAGRQGHRPPGRRRALTVRVGEPARGRRRPPRRRARPGARRSAQRDAPGRLDRAADRRGAALALSRPPGRRCSWPAAALTLGVVAWPDLQGWRSPGWRAPWAPAACCSRRSALKSTLALRGLAAAGRDVAGALQRGDLAAARTSVGFHLVSRPTATLRVEQVAAGAIESLAENLTDALVAPLLFFLVFGLPGRLGLSRAQHGRLDAGLSRGRARVLRQGRGPARRRRQPHPRAAVRARTGRRGRPPCAGCLRR